MSLRECQKKRSWLNFKYCKELGLEGVSETTKIAVPIANLSQGPPEEEARVLPTRRRASACFFTFLFSPSLNSVRILFFVITERKGYTKIRTQGKC